MVSMYTSPPLPLVISSLGAPNDEDGTLSPIARARVLQAIQLLHERPAAHYLPTGGFGQHFNTSSRAHWEWCVDFALSAGLKEQRILPGLTSSNTSEDMRMLAEWAQKNRVSTLIIVTSDFHIMRSRLLWSQTGYAKHVLFFPAVTPVDDEDFLKLVSHEVARLRELL